MNRPFWNLPNASWHDIQLLNISFENIEKVISYKLVKCAKLTRNIGSHDNEIQLFHFDWNIRLLWVYTEDRNYVNMQYKI